MGISALKDFGPLILSESTYLYTEIGQAHTCSRLVFSGFGNGGRRLYLARETKHFYLYFGNAHSVKSQFFSRCIGAVDNPASNKRPSVIDTYDRTFPVLKVCYPDHCIHWPGFMCRRPCIHIVPLAVACVFTVEVGTVPARNTLHFLPYLHISGSIAFSAHFVRTHRRSLSCSRRMPCSPVDHFLFTGTTGKKQT
ncbi:hypothetical protein MNB_SV-10-1312 [hydrothermal vent metagenome]|uniref:Uncharacterized protein n=1 Tax=hydrothermal vent metagenome TaxID=652676 RepID=A0A1W1BMK9_9ZZZZ